MIDSLSPELLIEIGKRTTEKGSANLALTCKTLSALAPNYKSDEAVKRQSAWKKHIEKDTFAAEQSREFNKTYEFAKKLPPGVAALDVLQPQFKANLCA